jgi:hypothetical protein
VRICSVVCCAVLYRTHLCCPLTPSLSPSHTSVSLSLSLSLSLLAAANAELLSDNTRLRKQIIALRKEISDSTATLEKLKIEHTRELLRLKSKFALSNGDRYAVGDSLDIYLPITPKLEGEGGSGMGSVGGIGVGGESERLLRRRILLLEKDLAVARGVRNGPQSRSGTPTTPGGRDRISDSDRERERERERIRNRRNVGGYSSGGTGYGGRPGGTGSSSGSRRASPSLLLSPTSASRLRERGAGYMRYGVVWCGVVSVLLVCYCI